MVGRNIVACAFYVLAAWAHAAAPGRAGLGQRGRQAGGPHGHAKETEGECAGAGAGAASVSLFSVASTSAGSLT